MIAAIRMRRRRLLPAAGSAADPGPAAAWGAAGWGGAAGLDRRSSEVVGARSATAGTLDCRLWRALAVKRPNGRTAGSALGRPGMTELNGSVQIDWSRQPMVVKSRSL